MNEASITRYITDTLDGVDVVVASREAGSPELAWGDTFFSYDPGRQLPPAHRFPFATIVTKDYGEFDCASQLDRPGVFRLNIGVSKETYRSLFGPQPSPPPAGRAVETGHDFAALDRLLPHPVYAPQSWVCVLNPSEATFEAVRPLLAEAHQLAVSRYAKRETRE
ncbi:DUF6194 family protein [Sorangium sp. So ce693]|uniref:DUF6194 family protein n=1 Tax=Sorangium sp. So ce693 TaxID=3133318 RepID=UPI003F616B59